jgi:hypothetical protein
LALFFAGANRVLLTVTLSLTTTYRKSPILQIGFVLSTGLLPPAGGLANWLCFADMTLFVVTPQGVSLAALAGTLRTGETKLALFRIVRLSVGNEQGSFDVPPFRRLAGMRLSPAMTKPSELTSLYHSLFSCITIIQVVAFFVK